jgi:hypothetical protein
LNAGQVGAAEAASQNIGECVATVVVLVLFSQCHLSKDFLFHLIVLFDHVDRFVFGSAKNMYSWLIFCGVKVRNKRDVFAKRVVILDQAPKKGPNNSVYSSYVTEYGIKCHDFDLLVYSIV